MPAPLGGFDYTWPFYLAGVLGYLIGSVPFGLLLTRLAGLGDLRKLGSGNIGATNVLRTGHKGLAALTLLLDALKGALPVIIAWHYGPDMPVIVGGAAVIGHVAPLWLLFRGGKGVATTLGVLLALDWPIGLIACAVWLAAAALFRFSSLAALIAIISAPGFMFWLGEERLTWVAGLLAVIVALKHLANIGRLIRGQEPKINFRRRAG